MYPVVVVGFSHSMTHHLSPVLACVTNYRTGFFPRRDHKHSTSILGLLSHGWDMNKRHWHWLAGRLMNMESWRVVLDGKRWDGGLLRALERNAL
jgi:hypothetical protein